MLNNAGLAFHYFLAQLVKSYWDLKHQRSRDKHELLRPTSANGRLNKHERIERRWSFLPGQVP